MVKVPLIVLLALLSLTTYAQETTKGAIFYSPDGSFTAQFHLAPTAVEGIQNNAQSISYQLTTDTYALSVLQTKRGSTGADDSKLLEENIELAKNALASSTSSTELVSSGKYQGRELIGASNGYRVKLRIFVSKDHVYTVSAIYMEHDDLSRVLANIFLDSFEITS